MINIQDKSKCCGCSACVRRCPKSCISLQEDYEGFLYPYVNEEACVDCGLCEKVCPVLNQNQPHQPLVVYAAKNPNEEIRMKSSSGGIFSLLAEKIIQEGGVVFGAKFDEKWEVVHGYTETLEGLEAFRGSKYVQSRIRDSYRDVECFLKKGRKVLFSGTPCQIAGLKRYLRKEYENLLAVDFVCHGVPSPMIWRDYLNKKIRPLGVVGKNMVSPLSLKDMPVITGISFRDKRNGWKKFGFTVRGKSASKADKNLVSLSVDDDTFIYESLDKNLYMQGFLKNFYLRPSCYMCKSKSGKSHSDITLGDFWGIQRVCQKIDDDKGVSLVTIYSSQGKTFYESLNADNVQTSYKDALKYNPSLERSVSKTKLYSSFWDKFRENHLEAIGIIIDKTKPSLLKKLYAFLRVSLASLIRSI